MALPDTSWKSLADICWKRYPAFRMIPLLKTFPCTYPQRAIGLWKKTQEGLPLQWKTMSLNYVPLNFLSLNLQEFAKTELATLWRSLVYSLCRMCYNPNYIRRYYKVKIQFLIHCYNPISRLQKVFKFVLFWMMEGLFGCRECLISIKLCIII